ncbi:MAG: hypothetical protein ACI4SQ_03640 [Eubacterium sp.]
MICISINHKKSIAKTRERFALSDVEKELFFNIAEENPAFKGCVLLMTCNRCEIYISGSSDVYQEVEKYFQTQKGIAREEFWKHAMRYEKKAALKHLYQVVCGLESAVLGEVEIIRQVKLAYESAKVRQMTDGELNIIFQSALQLAKEIADRSMMTRLPVSVGTLTTLDALQFCEAKEEPHILLVGARGDIGSIILRDLVDADKRVRIVATSRKHKQYVPIFRDTEQVSWVHYDKRYEYLKWADVVISATSSPHYTFLEENVKKIRRIKPICFIDLAIPRDVDEAIGKLDDCIVKNMDDIQLLAKKNNDKKLTEAKKIELIIDERVEEMEKTIVFRRFRGEFPEKMKRLEEKKASWLLYQLRENLELKAFEQVIKSLEGES